MDQSMWLPINITGMAVAAETATRMVLIAFALIRSKRAESTRMNNR